MENDTERLGIGAENDKLAGAAGNPTILSVLEMRRLCWRIDVRLGRLVSSLLELPIVASLLDAVQNLLDERSILSLGPGGRFVLAGHFQSSVWFRKNSPLRQASFAT